MFLSVALRGTLCFLLLNSPTAFPKNRTLQEFKPDRQDAVQEQSYEIRAMARQVPMFGRRFKQFVKCRQTFFKTTMNKADILKLCRLSCLLGFIATTGIAKAAPETKLELLETKTGVYSNVTVTSKTAQYVVILHSRGIGTIKVTDLSNEAQTQLGYVTAESAKEKSGAKIFARAKESLNALPNANELLAKLKTKSPVALSFENVNSTVLFAILGVSLFLYIVFCHCASVICQKTGNKPGLLIWLPILQMIPLYRAAGMSPIWAFVPLLNVFAQIVWSFKIAKARGKGALTGLLLLLPITSPLAFLYLAMSGEMPTEEKPKKFTATGLTFDTV